MQKPTNLNAKNWLNATQREPKTRGDFRIDQSINNTCVNINEN